MSWTGPALDLELAVSLSKRHAMLTAPAELANGLSGCLPSTPLERITESQAGFRLSTAWAMQAMKLVWLVKEVALTLHAHFPGRMAAVWVVEPPGVIDWPLRALKNLLNPAGTGAKIRACQASDPVLPVQLAPS